jgi:hypothetical protein
LYGWRIWRPEQTICVSFAVAGEKLLANVSSVVHRWH